MSITVSTWLLYIYHSSLRCGYTATNPLGVQVASLVTGLLAMLGILTFICYRLGDTPEDAEFLLDLKSLSE